MFLDVKKFMEACDQTTTTLNEEQANLYHNLIVEEWNEFLDTFKQEADAQNVEERRAAVVVRLEGCLDSRWVTYGYVLSIDPPGLEEYEKIHKFKFNEKVSAVMLDRSQASEVKLEDLQKEYDDLNESIKSRNEATFQSVKFVWSLYKYAVFQGWSVNLGWAEVTRSNMAKVDPISGKVIKNAAGKVQKPEGWTPPDLTRFV